MSDVTLKARVTKNGKPYVTNQGITYHDVNGKALDYLLGQSAKIGEKLAGHHATGSGPFEVSLEGDVDGKPFDPITRSGLSVTKFHALERHLNKIQEQMIDTSEKMHAKASNK